MVPNDFVLFRNLALDDVATSVQTSSVGEPSVANSGQQIFMTGNWYASKSLDNGATWQFVSPFNTLPPAAGGFCCDQVAHYNRSRDIFVWLLQYVRDNDGENVFRLAIKRGATLQNNLWHWWDFAPRGVNNDWQGLWFDYPDVALSDNHLWVTFNVFDGVPRWQRAVVFKFPLDPLENGGNLGYSWWSTTENGSLRLVQGASENMYWASHTSRRQMRLFRWEDAGNNIAFWNIDVNEWSGGTLSAPGPDERDWLGRSDPRITGAWAGDGVLGFMWTVNSRGNRPFPHVRVVRIDERTKTVIDQPDIWSQNAAWAYPAACVNDRGDVGYTLFYGGNERHPGHVVGISDGYGRQFVLSRTSSNGPDRNVSGDYLNVRRHAPDGLTWAASGFTMQGGTDRSHVEPRYVHFGRRRDERAVARWLSS